MQVPGVLRAIEESNLGQRFWRPQLCHLTNRPICLPAICPSDGAPSAPTVPSIAKFASSWRIELFLGLLECDVLAELRAVFLELDLALDLLAVLARPVGLACLLVLELYQLIL